MSGLKWSLIYEHIYEVRYSDNEAFGEHSENSWLFISKKLLKTSNESVWIDLVAL